MARYGAVMRQTIGGPNYAAEARRLARDLPEGLREAWLNATKIDLAADHNRTLLKPTALLAPASRCMIVSSALRLIPMGLELSPQVGDFGKLIERDSIEKLLGGPLGRMGMITQTVILRGVAAMGKRAFGADVRHIQLAVRRIRKRAHRIVRPGRLHSYQDYWDIALELAPYLEPGDTHDLETATQSRHAATLGVCLELALRRCELAGLEQRDIKIDYQRGIVDIVVRASLRKSGDSFVHRLSPSIAGLMIDYIGSARPFLIGYEGDQQTDAVWVSQKGCGLCPAGVVSTLRWQVRRALGFTASCNLFRRANASRGDIDEGETFLYLQHARGSIVGQEVYAERNRAAAQQMLISAWDSQVA